MFNVKALLDTLPYMLKGMAGIFISDRRYHILRLSAEQAARQS